MKEIKKICVFCASSPKIDKKFFDDAELLGNEFLKHNIHVVYGGGGIGLMGKLADTMISGNGMITGIIPRFMREMEWSHSGITEIIEVENMHERKKLMIKEADAVVALPGGVGTLEELTEVITLKQLGQFYAPIIILNTDGYYNHLTGFLDKMIAESFMNTAHKDLWTVVEKPSEVIPAILKSVPWDAGAIKFAAVKDK